MLQFVVAFAASIPALALSQSASSPRLIVAISVDQFSADLFAEYRPLYTAGLRRLSSGAVFPAGYQSHAATETCPGHSTILTGDHPSRTGIIANEWIDQSLSRPDKQVYCAEDPRVAGSGGARYTVSAQFLKVPTLGDRLKSVTPQSRVVSVAGKDRAAIMMGGHAIDQAWFWDGKSYRTLVTQTGPVPSIVNKVNASVARSIAHPAAAVLPQVCRSHSSPVSVGARTVGTLPSRAAGDYRAFRTSIDFDRATTDIAIGLIREMKLGGQDVPDVISIGLSATDYVGHAFGVEGAEMCAQVLSVDANIARILAALDALHLRYVVVLTADHGGHDLPERIRRRGIADATRVDPALTATNIGKRLAVEYGLTGPVLLGVSPAGDVYVSRDVPEAMRASIIEGARAIYLAHPQVAAVFTATELRRMPVPVGAPDEWSLADRFRASFDPDRSGDLLVALKPHVTPIADPSGSVARTVRPGATIGACRFFSTGPA